jgi:transcriptional antiterminator RfaH
VRWIVVRSHPQRENFAAESVSQQGYAVFLPRVLEYSGRGGHRFALAKPLFRSYLFVGIESRWRPLLSTFGVAAVIMAGESPGIVPPAVIEQLRSRLDIDGLVRLPKRQRGDRVEIVRGPFARHTGLYLGMSARDRVRVLLGVMGAQTSVLVHERDLDPVRVSAPLAGKGAVRVH